MKRVYRQAGRRSGDEAIGCAVYAGFSALSLPPQQQRDPQSQHHQSDAINRKRRAPLSQMERQVDDIYDGSDQEDDPADTKTIQVYHY